MSTAAEQPRPSPPPVADAVAPASTIATRTDDQPSAASDTPILSKTNRKVLLFNCLKHDRAKDVQKIINRNISPDFDKKIVIQNLRKPCGNSWAIVTLQEEEMVQIFIDLVNGNSSGWANKRGGIIRADRQDQNDNDNDERTRNDDRKRSKVDDDGDDGSSRKRAKVKHGFLSADEVRDRITPYWRLSTAEQLDRKQKEMIRKCSMSIIKEIKTVFRTREKEMKRNKHVKAIPMYEWVGKRKAINVDKIISSPTQFEYRNKCELTFGYRYLQSQATVDGSSEPSVDAKIPAVGYMTSGWSGGVTKPHSCPNTPTEACGVADLLDDFLSSSPIPPYDPKLHVGLWRCVTMRFSHRTNQCMIIMMHAPSKGGAGAKEDGSDDYSEYFESERKRLIKVLTEKPIPLPQRDYAGVDLTMIKGDNAEEESAEEKKAPLKVTSIFFQEYGGLSAPGPDHPVEHMYGNDYMEEILGKCTFQISPGAFFQVNTRGAETLYNVVVKQIQQTAPSEPEKVLLLDVCCGTGTIGLTCIKEGVAGRLLGVDVSGPAIKDAKINALKNWPGSSCNAHFIASRAELVLSKEIRIAREKYNVTNIIAVVDPARDGLHPDVIKTLRATGMIQRLIYVSCNPTKSLVRDAAMLCAPPSKKYAGVPFYISSASPVDMFPMTLHCEMVMTFDRLNETSAPDEKEKKQSASSKADEDHETVTTFGGQPNETGAPDENKKQSLSPIAGGEDEGVDV